MRFRLHYAEKNFLPDPRWRGKEGVVLCRGRGPGPRNVLVRTVDGEMVVVPRGNVKKVFLAPREGVFDAVPLLEKEQILRAIREAVSREGLVAAAYLMGSYADGTATHLSDVDVGIGIYPRPGVDAVEAAGLAAEIEYRLTQVLFPGYETEPCRQWLFNPVEVVVLNAPRTFPSLPWMLAGAVPVHAPDPAFQAALEEVAFARGRPSCLQARRAAWRLKARWIVRASLGKTIATYEGLLRTCLNLAHRAVVELELNVPARRQDLPAALAEARIVSPRTASFVAEAVEMLSKEDVPVRTWGHFRRNLRLLAEYALDVEDALERAVPMNA